MFLLQSLRAMYRRYVALLLGYTEDDAKSQVSEAVKLQWQREQDAMKQKLQLIDSEEVTDLMELLDQDIDDDSDDESDDDRGQEEQGDVTNVVIRDTTSKKEFFVAGVDISFVKGDDVNACAALVVLNIPRLEVVYEAYEMIELCDPYIPGFLGFREVPFICQLFEELARNSPDYIPQVIMVDGNGILHPKEFGSACHLGVSLDIACIGVAKKLFQVDGLEKDANHQHKIDGLKQGGETFPLQGNSGKILGMALRSCNNTRNPIYVSQGHKISLDTAVRLVHFCCRHRVPEPVRLADINSREYLRVNFKPLDPSDRGE